MSDDRHQDDGKAPFRRSRKDQEGRDYICGCGKKYLSYPALYTHIKTKHDGQQPIGTQKTGNGTVKRVKPKFEQQLIKRITTLLDKQDLSVLKQLPNCQGSISFQKRLKKENLPKQVFDYYSNSDNCKFAWKMDKSMCVQGVLLLFLLSAGQYICQPLLNLLVQFAKIVLNCFSQYGAQIFKNVFMHRVTSMKLSKPFNQNECRYLPIICDFMVRFYIPAEYKDIQAPIMELIFNDFVKWMRKNKLTSIEVKFKKEFNSSSFNSTLWKMLKQYKYPNDINDQNSINSNVDQNSNQNNQSEKNNYQYDEREQQYGQKYNSDNGQQSRNREEDESANIRQSKQDDLGSQVQKQDINEHQRK